MRKRKKEICIFGLLIFAVFVIPFSVSADEGEVKIQVDGLSCPFCVAGLKKRLGGVEALKEVQVDLKTGLVEAKWDESKSFDEETIRKAVQDAGFTPREVSYTGT